jgi:hypothetical protein
MISQILLREPIHFDAQAVRVCGIDALTERRCLRVWTAPGQSHLIPSAWLDIPAGGWLVIEFARVECQ